MPVKFLKGLSTTLKRKENPKPDLKDGQIIFTTDDRRLYIDHCDDPSADKPVIERLAVAAGGATFFVSELLTKNGVEADNYDFSIDCKSFLEEEKKYEFMVDYQPKEGATEAENFKYRCDIIKTNFNAKLEDRKIKIIIPKDIDDNAIRINVLFWEIEHQENENTEES